MKTLNHLKYNESPFFYKRRPTREVKVGSVGIGGKNPIRVQSMTNTDTKDIESTLRQIRELEEAGSELVRITVPTSQDAEALPVLRKRMKEEKITVPIVADIHFTPSIAMKAVEYVEKVRINPGNFADRKKFAVMEYTDEEYQRELDRIYESFSPLVKRAKELGVAMRIGTNHGSLSDRIMNRYGDTPEGMVESALEFIKIAESHSYKDIIVSMKASNTQVMVQAYRLLVSRFYELGMDYPLHLGVTEAGDGKDGRIKSAIGIGSLLDDGLGDTIRVSLTEDPVLEIPVAKKLVEKYNQWFLEQKSNSNDLNSNLQESIVLKNNTYKEFRNLYSYSRFYSQTLPYGRESFQTTSWFGENNPIRVEASFQGIHDTTLNDIANLIQKGNENGSPPESIHFTLSNLNELERIVLWKKEKSIPLPLSVEFLNGINPLDSFLENILGIDKWVIPFYNFSNSNNQHQDWGKFLFQLNKLGGIVEWKLQPLDFQNIEFLLDFLEEFQIKNSCISVETQDPVRDYRKLAYLISHYSYPIVLIGNYPDYETALYNASIGLGSLLLDGIGDLIRISCDNLALESVLLSYDILQGCRLRLSRTEYISCPSCGRTQFDLQETTQKIKELTNHLKGVKIAVMGCIVNGPGEMADADFGYVGAAPGKVHLYKGKEIIEKNVPEREAPQKLIQLIKDSGMWVEPSLTYSPH